MLVIVRDEQLLINKTEHYDIINCQYYYLFIYNKVCLNSEKSQQ